MFWAAGAFNARNQLTQETLGNGLVANRVYDAVSGWLRSIQTGPGGGTSVQNLAYEWDKAGNLSSRVDKNQANLTEAFVYDNLYRLDHSTLNGVPNLNMSYDALGNITSKSDVGAYTYHTTRKHQVVSTSNGWSFGYDANGNMTSGRGATITPTSYNYPASITNGADSSSFSYTPDRQYWKQVSNYTSGGAATTIYVGDLLEKVTTSLGTDYRHMIRAGGSTIIVSRQSTGANNVYYVTSDHLGSSSAVTNSSGSIVVNESFGAFGARRGSNWSGSPSSGDWSAIASTTRRGFTEHSMLDNLNLIHMNGRVYDSMIGKFLSADSFIPDLANTQSYNRYTYLTNNPLNATDPNGFWPKPSGSYLDGTYTFFGCHYEDVYCAGWFDYTATGDASLTRIAKQPGRDRENDPGGIGSLPVATLAEVSTSFASWGATTGCEVGKEGMCHRSVPKLAVCAGIGCKPTPGFMDAHGFVFNLIGAGFIDCLIFNSGTPYACSGRQYASEGGNYVLAVVPIAKPIGPVFEGVVGSGVFRTAADGIEGVALREGQAAARGMQAHHIFPQAEEFAANWKSAGINIEQFRVQISEGAHLGQLHSSAGIPGVGPGGIWNETWRQYFAAEAAAGRAITEEGIFVQAAQMLGDFGVPYFSPVQ